MAWAAGRGCDQDHGRLPAREGGQDGSDVTSIS